ncbi:hypothetical protein [Clostridium oceanicum]|uniref:PepSY domain-containing protein n=1 Tax=Clostridium oceanicum TaxID=1543 RepID=A0ABN1JFU6_9CLOT
MKLRKRLAITVFIILMIIVTISFTYMSISILHINEVVIAAPKNQSISTKKYIEKIDRCFKDKLEFEIDKKNIEFKTHYAIGNDNEKYFTLTSNNDDIYYKGRINTKTGEVIELYYNNNREFIKKNKKVNEKHGIRDSKKIALNFIKNNNILDGSKVNFIEEYIKSNSKGFDEYNVFFKYNNTKKILVKIDKNSYKVKGFLLEN